MDRTQRTLVEENLDLVSRMAGTFVRRYPHGPDWDEFTSAGNVALCGAASRFDSSKGEFRSYASCRVYGAMYDAYRRFTRQNSRVQFFTPCHLAQTDWGLNVEPCLSPPDEQFVWKERRRLLWKKVRGLPERQAAVMEGIFRGKNVSQTAKELGVHGATVVRIRNRIIKKLQASYAAEAA